MKTNYQSALIVAGLILMPILVVLLADFINIIVIIITYSLTFALVTYYLYVDIKEELDWKEKQILMLTHGFDAEKMRFFKFYMKYFNP